MTTFKHSEEKSPANKQRAKFSKDGCVWRAGPSRVGGQEAGRGERRRDEAASST